MSKLKKKMVKKVLGYYLLILIIGMVGSYFIIYLPMKDRTLESLRNENNYIVEETDVVLGNMREFANYVAHSKSIRKGIALEGSETEKNYELANELNHFSQMKNAIRGIALFENDKPPIYSLIAPPQEARDYLDNWREIFQEQEHFSGFSDAIYVKDKSTNSRILIGYGKNYKIKIGNFGLVVFFDYDESFGGINRYKDNVFSKHTMLNANGESIFGQEQDGGWNNLFEIQNERKKGVMQEVDGGGIYLFQPQLESSYISAAYVSSSKFMDRFSGYVILILILLLLFFLITLSVVVRMIGQVTDPIYELSKVMDVAVQKKLEVKVRADADDEIGQLGQNFNIMMEDIKTYVSQIVKKENQEQQMKFGLLISQIDPHFVCNTLNTIVYLSKKDRGEDAIEVSVALSRILRDRLRLKEFQVFDYVKQEIETVLEYVKIQQYRYGNAVKVECLVSEDVRYAMMPKNIIQPLVENSLFHGLASIESGDIAGNISIKVYQEGNRIIISVADDGMGMPPDIVRKYTNDKAIFTTKEKRGQGIGLGGVIERLELLYGAQFELQIQSEQGQGTKIIISIDKEKRKTI